MSTSPAISEVGSPIAISSSKCAANSPRVLFNELTSLPIQKGIKKSASTNLSDCSIEISPNRNGRRIRTSSHSSNTSSFSTSSKVGSRIELDRADMDLDWRSSPRLRCSSGSSEESIKSKKGDEQPLRSDRDFNWRKHDQPNSFSSSSQLNWRIKNEQKKGVSCLGMWHIVLFSLVEL